MKAICIIVWILVMTEIVMVSVSLWIYDHSPGCCGMLNELDALCQYKYNDGITYTGELKNFLWHGNGTAEYPDGSKYIGEFQNGLWHGKGEYQSPDGSSQKGDYQNGIFQPDDT